MGVTWVGVGGLGRAGPAWVTWDDLSPSAVRETRVERKVYNEHLRFFSRFLSRCVHVGGRGCLGRARILTRFDSTEPLVHGGTPVESNRVKSK